MPFLASPCGYLLLVTVGDKILTQLDPWSEYVWLGMGGGFHFSVQKNLVSIFSGWRNKLEKRLRLMKIHCGIPLFFTQFDDNIKSLFCLFVITFPETYFVHWSSGPDFRSTNGRDFLTTCLLP